MKKRTRKELAAAPKPCNPAELEVLSHWYFGKALHLGFLSVFERLDDSLIAGSVQYEVTELYNSYHGAGWLHSENCIKGYDYSGDFWGHVIGPLYCGGIASRSYGQVRIVGHRDLKRLMVFQGYLGRKESGRLRKPFERLAREYGAGENTATRDSGVLIAGRVDGAAAVSSHGAQP